MSVQVTVNDITGSTPFDIYVCDSSQTTCIYINQITNLELPYNFIIPPPFDTQSSYVLRVIDTYGCEITNNFSIS
jgi:hypothetical protein